MLFDDDVCEGQADAGAVVRQASGHVGVGKSLRVEVERDQELAAALVEEAVAVIEALDPF
jgi:hypothetical protein